MINRRLGCLVERAHKAVALGVEYGFDLTVVAVDTGGHPVVVLRSDRAGYATLDAARRKAIAAMSLKFPTATIAELLADDDLARAAFAAAGDALAVPGGFPIFLDHVCIGGIGIAGGHYTEDHMIGEKMLAFFTGADAASVAAGIGPGYVTYEGDRVEKPR